MTVDGVLQEVPDASLPRSEQGGRLGTEYPDWPGQLAVTPAASKS
jgi:hypothetical protein